MKKIILTITFLLTLAGVSFANEVNIFSARHYDSDIQLYEKFTAKTGIKVNVVSGKSKVLEKRIIEEGADCVADLYITADAGRLGAAKAKGMLQGGLTSEAIKSVVPKNFRSSHWVGIAKRARIVYFAPERVSGAELSGLTYESLADPKWKGRLVISIINHLLLHWLKTMEKKRQAHGQKVLYQIWQELLKVMTELKYLLLQLEKPILL